MAATFSEEARPLAVMAAAAAVAAQQTEVRWLQVNQ
jgi:hypothetical protein